MGPAAHTTDVSLGFLEQLTSLTSLYISQGTLHSLQPLTALTTLQSLTIIGCRVLWNVNCSTPAKKNLSAELRQPEQPDSSSGLKAHLEGMAGPQLELPFNVPRRRTAVESTVGGAVPGNSQGQGQAAASGMDAQEQKVAEHALKCVS